MKRIKRTILLVAALMLLLAGNYYAESLKNKTFQFNPSRKVTLKWGWDLFASRANATNSENINLTKAAAYLCEGTYRGASNIKNRMKALGFENINTEYFKKYANDNQANTSPIAFGSKVTTINNKKQLVVVVAIRGTLLDENGWDFITDVRSGIFNADGFFDSGETGRKDTEKNIKKQQKKSKLKKKDTVVFITGHSLGAAVAGQTARALQGNLANIENIFCYTFASPFYKTFGNEASYRNIHNFINTEDAVPKFPLGGKRNGVDHKFKGNGTDIVSQHAKMEVYLDGAISYFKEKRTGGFGGRGRGDKEKKDITLNKKSIEIEKGKTYKLKATVTGMKKNVTWTTSNKRIATVKNGVITGKGKGTATITAKCGGKTAKCKVTVKAKEKDGVYHTEKGNVRYENDSSKAFDLKVKIEDSKLIIEGKLMKSVNSGERELVPGKKHIFILSSKTQFWSGDSGISKEAFLKIPPKCIGYKGSWLILDMNDGKVSAVGIVG